MTTPPAPGAGREAERRAWPWLASPAPGNHLVLPTLFPPSCSRYEFEIGCGKGGFLVDHCESHPESGLMGAEVDPERAAYIADRIERRNLPNARIHRGDAATLLKHHLPAASLTAVHLYCPDPWWKKRHHKRRVLNEELTRILRRVLLSDGRLHFASDVEETFALGLRTFLGGGGFIPCEDQRERGLTSFERKAEEGGRPTFRVTFRLAG